MKLNKSIFTLAVVGAMTVTASAADDVQTRMLETFTELARINSQSSYDSVSTYGQHVMAFKIESDVKALFKGDSKLGTVTVSPSNYVYVALEPNVKKECPTLGISCHLDVTPEVPGENIVPVVDTRNGHTIVRTDGSTLLGADDKCGVTIALQLIDKLVKDKSVKHGKVMFAFCPNEDVGRAADDIDTTLFNPDILFDLDGPEGEIVTRSNFTARGFNVKFKGREAHPSTAKADRLGDATAAAATFIAFFPIEHRPETTDGLQGYIHPWDFVKEDADVTVQTRVRYFDKEEGIKFDRLLKDAVAKVEKDYPNVGVDILFDGLQYENVAYSMHPASQSLIESAAAKTGKHIRFADERGGTTASMSAAKGLKGGMCIFTGQHDIHSTREWADLQEMEEAYSLMLEVIRDVANLKY